MYVFRLVHERMLQHECIHNQNGRDNNTFVYTHTHTTLTFNSIKTDMHSHSCKRTYVHTYTGAHIDNRILFLNGSRALECVSLPKGTILYTYTIPYHTMPYTILSHHCCWDFLSLIAQC